jgi:phage gpG-like protein
MTRFSTAFTKIRNQAGVLAVNHFKQSFIKGGFTDNGFEAWKIPKRKKGKNAEKTRKGTRATLVKSGTLKRSIRVTKTSGFDIAIGSDLPYAQVHNEGLKAGRGKGFIMPQRQFIGNSAQLEAQITKMAEKELLKAFK